MLSKSKQYIKTTRFKTTIWYSSLFLALEIIIGAVIYFYLDTSLNKQLDSALSRQAETIHNFVIGKKFELDDFQPDSVYNSADDLVYDLIFEAVAFNPRNTFIQVELNEKVIFKTENLRTFNLRFPRLTDTKVHLSTFHDSRLSEQSSIRCAFLNKEGYKIIVAFPTDLRDETLKSLQDIYIILAPIFFFISMLGGALISAKSLSRIDSIIKKTDEITAQSLDERIDGEEFDDEYGRLVRTMNNMIKRIKTSIEYMDQFSNSASHELKTPLTILRGEIELALRSEKTPEQYREVLRSNYEETLRLIRIVEKLFLVSKIDHSKISINRTAIRLSEFLDEIVRKYFVLAEEKGLELRLELQEDIKLELDQDWMEQALHNLIENAIKYSYPGKSITVKAGMLNKEKSRRAFIELINYGDPIPKEIIPKLFDRFFRIETSRNRNLGGIGLGLSLVQSIVNWHNGTISVTSAEDGKITFRIEI